MSNEEALNEYDIDSYRTPDGYTSDIAVFTITDLMSGKAHFFRGGMKANRSQEASNEMSLFNVPILRQFTM